MKPANLLRIHESAMRLEVLGFSSPGGTIKLLSRGGHKTGNFLFSVQIARDMDMFMNACKPAAQWPENFICQPASSPAVVRRNCTTLLVPT